MHMLPSFETAAARPPQDEDLFFMPSTIYLILETFARIVNRDSLAATAGE